MTTAVSQDELTAEDRCDRCSARALLRATFLHGDLLFCGHHARETGYKLALKAVSVYDPEGLLHYED
jgi:hypothetical protein